jgi:hypothetical protein
MGRDAYHDGNHKNPFPLGIIFYWDWCNGFSIESAYGEWYAEDFAWDEQEDIDFYENEQLDWEPEPFEIDANDFYILDRKHPDFEE